ncbi:hypothetical protein J5N97_015794 [Dioscorea zingiberensis]|uniref:Uncharacterized protein n=1 Tax=Dioscorea zingiberensis TaxID=325984 RepID=A0A9D5CJ26_9LILI|nr:hypothetical protein J5N97_015794 [Dioscorea zingiberensis]
MMRYVPALAGKKVWNALYAGNHSTLWRMCLMSCGAGTPSARIVFSDSNGPLSNSLAYQSSCLSSFPAHGVTYCHSACLQGQPQVSRKNFFLLWMVESMTGDRGRSHPSFCTDHQPAWPSNTGLAQRSNGPLHHNLRRAPYVHQDHPHPSTNQTNLMPNHLNVERIHSSLCKSLAFFVNLTAKFPLIIIFLLIILYAIPASATILALYILVTVLFALPSFLILYFAYPSLDWLIKEIFT